MPIYTEESLKVIVKESYSYSEVLRKFNLAIGGNHKILKKYCKKWDIDTSHFLSPSENMKKLHREGYYKKATPLSEILVKNSTYNRSHLKARLYKTNIKKRICEMCGLGEVWNGNKMSLILDHINGIRNDNRVENLRILCPNCNATLPTHCGKSNANPKKRCKDCNNYITSKAEKCNTCENGSRTYPNRHITWPSNDELRKLVWEFPRSTLSKQLGVSDVAIAKRCRKHNIPQPPRGYWAKKYSDK